MLDRFSHLGFVFFEDVNVDIRGDFSIAMTEVLGNCLNIKIFYRKKTAPKLGAVIFEKFERVGKTNYLLENWGARRAALRPYFFLSFILGSRVRRPALLSMGL